MKVIIIGNSAAGLSALEAFRKIDTVSKVWVVTKESPRPYSRVQLPYYLTDRVALDSLAIRPDNHLHELNAKIITGQVVGLDTAAKTVHLNTGQSLAYDRLLIASGSTPFTPAITGIGLPGVHNIWTMEDALALKNVLIEGQRILIIGGGRDLPKTGSGYPRFPAVRHGRSPGGNRSAQPSRTNRHTINQTISATRERGKVRSGVGLIGQYDLNGYRVALRARHLSRLVGR